MLLSVVSIALAAPLFVQASVARVREAPEGPVAHRLRIGSEVAVEARQGDWAQVRLVGRPDAHPVAGWVHADLLGPQRPRLDALLADPSDPVAVERATTLDPYSAEVRAAWAASHAEALVDSSIFVAQCLDDRAVVIGELTAEGLRHVDASERPALLERLATEAWYAGPRPIEGTPFPSPFASAIDNEEPVSAYEAGVSLLGDEVQRKLVLGPCEGDVVYATHPLTPIRATPAPARPFRLAALDHITMPLRGATARAALPGATWLELTVDVDMHPADCGGVHEEWVQASLVRLIDPGSSQVIHDLGSVEGPALWVELGEQRLGIYTHRLLTRTRSTLVLDGDVPEALSVVHNYWGC